MVAQIDTIPSQGLLDWIKSQPGLRAKECAQALTEYMSPLEAVQFVHSWESCLAHPYQLPPSEDWLIWLLLGGRGAGKTRAGAEWVRAQVSERGKRHVALVAPTYNDAREVMLEGESGLLNIGLPSERPAYIASRRRLEWSNGASGQVFTAEEPDGLRGPQFDAAWADEFCAWRSASYTLSNLRLALRLGDAPQLVITTTPKPTLALKKLMETSGLAVNRARTEDNRDNLADGFIDAMQEAYGGTRLGRQELEGVIIEDIEGALWSHQMIEQAYIRTRPELSHIIIAIDPPVTSGPKSDACGLIVVGLAGAGRNGIACILYDGTVQGLSPQGWAQEAVALYNRFGADYVLAEVNQGGEMVSTILRHVDPHVPVKTVYARKSKTARAVPVAMLYEQGRVRHVGRFTELEDELCQMGTSQSSERSGHSGSKSPDRADALVWGVTDLLINSRVEPSMRTL